MGDTPSRRPDGDADCFSRARLLVALFRGTAAVWAGVSLIFNRLSFVPELPTSGGAIRKPDGASPTHAGTELQWTMPRSAVSACARVIAGETRRTQDAAGGGTLPARASTDDAHCFSRALPDCFF